MPVKKPNKQQALERKLREYKKVLKADHDWDWAYILLLLRYKLERTRKCILANNIIVSAPKVARQIKEVEILLERVVADNYYEEISRDFHKKYGNIRMKFGKAKRGSSSVPVTIKYAKENKNNQQQIRKESLRLHRRAEQMRHRDLKRAFNLMLKNIWGWWD